MGRLRLSDIGSGGVRVLALAGDSAENKRLSDLGLHPGARVEILQRNAQAGILLAVNDDARIVVDAKTARQVIVDPLEPQATSLALSQLVPGDRARIVGLGRSQLAYRQKLMSMGLTPGVEFEITRVAPLGDPVEIRVRGFAMSLRRDEAEMVTVEKVS